MPHCPTFRELHVETESPRGRLHLMRALGEGRVQPTETFVRHMTLCLDCRACEAACPSGVKFGQLMEATRAEIRHRRPGSPAERALLWLVFGQLLPHPRRLASLGVVLRLYQRSGLQRAVRASGLLRALPGRLDHLECLLPRLSKRFFEPRGEVAPRGQPRERVALFAGCVMRLAFAETNRATVRVLARNGCAVALADNQTCCGALHLHAGEREPARAMARRNIEAFDLSRAKAIVVNAAGCGAVLKKYGGLLAHDPAWAERARRFAARVRDLSELLVDLPFDPPRAELRARVTYQDACHLAHAQRIREQPRQVLRAIPGLEVVEMLDADRCCGSAGLYNVTEPDLADRFGAQKVDNVEATGAELAVSGNPGCLIQLRSVLDRRGSPIRAVHLADVLDAAYRAERRR